MERWESLRPGGFRFLQEAFRPGTDTFLLSSLPRLKPGLRVCDLGSGAGLLGLLLLQRQKEITVVGVDIREGAVRLGERIAVENGLTDRLAFRLGDLRDIRGLLPAGTFDLAVCNPPYYPSGHGGLPAAEEMRIARAETACTLEDICRASACLLRWGGSFCMVHKPERLTDLLCALRAAGLEPKRLREVCKRAGSAPSLVLLESRRGGKPGLSVEAPLLLQDETGASTAELDAIYFRKEDGP